MYVTETVKKISQDVEEMRSYLIFLKRTLSFIKEENFPLSIGFKMKEIPPCSTMETDRAILEDYMVKAKNGEISQAEFQKIISDMLKELEIIYKGIQIE